LRQASPQQSRVVIMQQQYSQQTHVSFSPDYQQSPQQPASQPYQVIRPSPPAQTSSAAFQPAMHRQQRFYRLQFAAAQEPHGPVQIPSTISQPPRSVPQDKFTMPQPFFQSPASSLFSSANFVSPLSDTSVESLAESDGSSLGCHPFSEKQSSDLGPHQPIYQRRDQAHVQHSRRQLLPSLQQQQPGPRQTPPQMQQRKLAIPRPVASSPSVPRPVVPNPTLPIPPLCSSAPTVPAPPGPVLSGPAVLDPSLYDDAQEKMDLMKICFMLNRKSYQYSLVVNVPDL
jgi:hypothetical protein